MRLNVKSFALTCGILYALVLFLLPWWLIILGEAVADPTLLTMTYPGYAFTPMGSVLGLAYGLIDGLVFGLIFAAIHNGLRRLFAGRPGGAAS